ncbi:MULTISPECIES: hypothetical protein [unclassified Nocardia]|uniref:hypothetical protein n=1 Tax=unclassified Nocardia TaxID=2637762 RepID=UPI001CE4324B|nr:MULTISPECIES: hypothetical protein [unclassified Nocardia]
MGGTEWEMFCSEVAAIVERYGVTMYTFPGVVTVSSDGPASVEDQASGANPAVSLTDMGDSAVRIETGWCIRAVADYEIDEEPSQAISAVEAIILGRAEEYVITDENSRWVGYGWRIWGDGFEMTQAAQQTRGHKAVRRLQAWRSQ